MKSRWIALAAVIALSGCGAPTVPDFTYFRLPEAQPLDPAPAPLFGDVVVEIKKGDTDHMLRVR